MTNVINLFSRKSHDLDTPAFDIFEGDDPTLRDERRANFKILEWDDPVMEGYTQQPNRQMVEGLLPPELASQIKALCDEHNARLGLNRPQAATKH